MSKRLQQLKQRMYDRKHPPAFIAVHPARWAWTCTYCGKPNWSDEPEIPDILQCESCDYRYIGLTE